MNIHEDNEYFPNEYSLVISQLILVWLNILHLQRIQTAVQIVWYMVTVMQVGMCCSCAQFHWYIL